MGDLMCMLILPLFIDIYIVHNSRTQFANEQEYNGRSGFLLCKYYTLHGYCYVITMNEILRTLTHCRRAE